MGNHPAGSRIEDYALIGDLQTAALAGRDGSIDWLCLPRFDSPACLAALAHDDSAGSLKLAPTAGGTASERSYRDETRWCWTPRGERVAAQCEWST
jgi:GH15 family glucan-1,4-alpha-glucosidase